MSPINTGQRFTYLPTLSQSQDASQALTEVDDNDSRINQVPDHDSSPDIRLNAPSCESEWQLISPTHDGPSSANHETSSGCTHEHLTAPLMTRGAMNAVGLAEKTQYGVLGQILSLHSNAADRTPEDSLLYLNTNAPFSALVCGVQGAGKSHTVATMLESMFVPQDKRIGTLQKPLSGLVLHLSEGGPHSSPSEAAWIGVSKVVTSRVPKVKVYVSPSSLKTMTAVYTRLGKNISVHPLYFAEHELDAQAFLSMMAVGSSESAPLYVQIILSILRELGERFTYQAFKVVLDEKRRDFNPQQQSGLKQRMALLESFMSKGKRDDPSNGRFKEGQLTIIDLSDPFIDPSSACGIFEVVTRLFVRAQVDTGKVILVDEAHKYLSVNNSAAGLTNALLTLIREQRHKGMRVIISTQEPTVVPPVLIDLCSINIFHRFSSPSWWEHVIKHVPADVSTSAFDLVVKLKTGEAIVLAPSGLCVSSDNADDTKNVEQYGRRFLRVRVRRRVTEDGGASILVV